MESFKSVVDGDFVENFFKAPYKIFKTFKTCREFNSDSNDIKITRIVRLELEIRRFLYLNLSALWW